MSYFPRLQILLSFLFILMSNQSLTWTKTWVNFELKYLSSTYYVAHMTMKIREAMTLFSSHLENVVLVLQVLKCFFVCKWVGGALGSSNSEFECQPHPWLCKKQSQASNFISGRPGFLISKRTRVWCQSDMWLGRLNEIVQRSCFTLKPKISVSPQRTVSVTEDPSLTIC